MGRKKKDFNFECNGLLGLMLALNDKYPSSSSLRTPPDAPSDKGFHVGCRVRTLRDFFQLPKGSTGIIYEDYGTGFMVQWDDYGFKDGFDKNSELCFLEKVQ